MTTSLSDRLGPDDAVWCLVSRLLDAVERGRSVTTPLRQISIIQSLEVIREKRLNLGRAAAAAGYKGGS